MTILFGHPTGNPNSHHAALAHWERGRLEAFCVPWMPTPGQLALLDHIPRLRPYTARLSRRSFAPLLSAPRIEGRASEWLRMGQRLIRGRWRDEERLSYQANDWLMDVMSRQVRRSTVTAVHAYEDCSLLSFEEAKRRGKACIYDMPIGYYDAWQQTQQELKRRFVDWLPQDQSATGAFARPEQKRREMALADLVLAPSGFVRDTILRFVDKPVTVAPYGVDLERWRPGTDLRPAGSPLRFLYVGHISIRKGLPILLEAWRRANLCEAQLDLVGSWYLAEKCKAELPPGVRYLGHCSAQQLREHYQAADAFVFPSFFEGFALVIGEALASGLPVLASQASGAADIIDDTCGRIFPAGNIDALVDELRAFSDHRERVPQMKQAARLAAEKLGWENYRAAVSAAVEPFC
jgi:starch synthase